MGRERQFYYFLNNLSRKCQIHSTTAPTATKVDFFFVFLHQFYIKVKKNLYERVCLRNFSRISRLILISQGYQIFYSFNEKKIVLFTIILKKERRRRTSIATKSKEETK